LRFQLEQEVRAAIARFGKTVLLVSHNRDEVFRLADHIAVMGQGTIEAYGEKKAIFAEPRTRNGAALTGCKNISPVREVSGPSIHAGDWDLTLDCGGKSTATTEFVGIRAHDIALTDAEGLPNSYEYEIVSTLRDTFSYILLIKKKGSQTGKTLRLEMSREKYEAMAVLPHYLHIPPEKILLLDR